MAKAVTSTSLRHRGRVEYIMSLEPLHVNPEAIVSAVGAIVCIGHRHWVALRYVDGKIWFLDSQEAHPKIYSWTTYATFIKENLGAFYIDFAPDVS